MAPNGLALLPFLTGAVDSGLESDPPESVGAVACAAPSGLATVDDWACASRTEAQTKSAEMASNGAKAQRARRRRLEFFGRCGTVST